MAKEGSKKTASANKERDKAKEEAQVARLAAIVVGNVKEKIEGDLTRVKDALAAVEESMVVTEEARHKVESEVARLEVDVSPARTWDCQRQGGFSLVSSM